MNLNFLYASTDVRSDIIHGIDNIIALNPPKKSICGNHVWIISGFIFLIFITNEINNKGLMLFSSSRKIILTLPLSAFFKLTPPLIKIIYTS